MTWVPAYFAAVGYWLTLWCCYASVCKFVSQRKFRLQLWKAGFMGLTIHSTAQTCHQVTIFCSDVWRNICMTLDFQVI